MFETKRACPHSRRKLQHIGWAAGITLTACATFAANAQMTGAPPRPKIIIAPTLNAHPSTSFELDIRIEGESGLPQGTYLEIRGLPQLVTLSAGQALSRRSWSLPLDALANLRLQLPENASGKSDLDLRLVTKSYVVVAFASTELIIAPAGAVTADTQSGGSTPAAVEPKTEATAQDAQAERRAEAERAEAERLAEAARLAEAERVAEAERMAKAERKAEAERVADAERKAEAERRAEAERKAEAERRAEAERKAEAERVADAARKAEAERLADAERKAEAERRAEAERKAQEERRAEAERKAEAERVADAERKAEAERRAEAERKAEAERRAEAERVAEAERKAEAERVAEAEAEARRKQDASSATTTAMAPAEKDAGTAATQGNATQESTPARKVDEIAPGPVATNQSTGESSTPLQERRELAITAPPVQDANRAQAERLVGRGDQYLAQGNMVIARQYYLRAADLGDAHAALKLGETYDPNEITRFNAVGTAANPALARRWYQRAAELGAPDAERKLHRLSAR